MTRRPAKTILRLAFSVALGVAGSLPARPDERVTIPVFVDTARQVDKPDLGERRTLRFLTSDDFPPFNFAAADGSPTGYNVDLVRAVCEVLKVACSVEVRGFESLVPALEARTADAVVAGLAITAASRATLDFSLPTMRLPARFAARAGSPVTTLDPATMARVVVGVQSGTAHEAFLRAFYPQTILRPFADPSSLRAALRAGDVDLLFADGFATALWLGGVASGGCCTFVGGPFTESRFFGDGTGIAVRKGDEVLRQAFDYALIQLAARGTLADLYLKYFPVGFF